MQKLDMAFRRGLSKVSLGNMQLLELFLLLLLSKVSLGGAQWSGLVLRTSIWTIYKATNC